MWVTKDPMVLRLAPGLSQQFGLSFGMPIMQVCLGITQLPILRYPEPESVRYMLCLSPTAHFRDAAPEPGRKSESDPDSHEPQESRHDCPVSACKEPRTRIRGERLEAVTRPWRRTI